jgi:uncharacterized protein (DUF1697 family)
MPTYVAFLRAINVGGHIVKMDRLQKLFEANGCTDVETVIASGNVIFQSVSRSEKALAARIGRCLEDGLGYPVATFLRTPAELSGIARRKPFSDDAPSNLYVGFLSEAPPAAAVRALRALASDVDDFRVVGREVYWLCRTSFSRSDFSGAKIEKLLGAATTLRNITTVRRIAEKLSA